MNTNLVFPSTSIVVKQEEAKSPHRKISLAAGILYLLTFISIPTFVLYGSAHDPNFIMGSSNDNAIVAGSLLEITVALAGIATALVLYPVLRKQNETVSLALVAARVLEAATIFVGVAFLLGLATLHQSGAGKDALITSHTLVALYDRIFILGQGFIPAIDDVLLGTLLYKSRLVPRSLSMIGIFGALFLITGYVANMFGYIDRFSPLTALSAVPVAVFEFSLGIYLVVHGFRKSNILTDIKF